MLSDNANNWCVYIHTAPNGKRYVGITSQSVKERWRNGNGYKHNSHFTRAINKYGWDAISHEVVANGLSEDAAKQMEIELIQRYNSTNQDCGYNISCGGEGTLGVRHYGEDNPFYGKHHSQENKMLISDTVKHAWGTGIFDEVMCRPVYQFDMDGNFLKAYKSVRQAEDETGISHSVICRVCNGKLNYTHGFTWAYQDECLDLQKFKHIFLCKMQDKQSNHAKHLRKAVELFDLQGNLIGVYESASKLAREIGVHKDTVSAACKNGSTLQKKYKCNYAKGGC